MYIQSIGIAGSGFNNWSHAKTILKHEKQLSINTQDQYKTTVLKPNEARRTSTAIKIALQSAEETLFQSSFQADQLYSVFVSSDGDPIILQSICQELSTAEKFVSPTQFHNSVHNAPAGYWSIGQSSTKGINSIACGDCSLSGALIEAKSLLKLGESAVLIVCFDIKSPTPLDSARHIRYSLATSMIVTEQSNAASLFFSELHFEELGKYPITKMADKQLEALRSDNPTSKCLPLLQALSGLNPGELTLPYSCSMSLRLKLSPC